MNIKKITLMASLMMVSTTVSFAAENNALSILLKRLSEFLPKLMDVGVVLAGLAFVYSITMFILNPENIEYGKTVMTWGLGALFVMFSFTAIIDEMQKMIFVDGMGNVTIPELPK